jgi:teichuronic acid biosynthesis glycosyltransferase TuaC
MNVLFLSSVYPHCSAPVRGTYNAELCRAFAERVDVEVVAPLPWTESLRRFRHWWNTGVGAATHEAAGFHTTWPIYYYPPGICRASYGSWMWQSIRRHVSSVVSTHKPDWVLSYWAHPDGDAGLQAARSCGAKSGVIIGGSDVLILTDRPARKTAIVKVLTESDAVFTVCDGLRDRVIELGVAPERVHTVYQGIRPDRFAHGDRAVARRALGIPPDVDAFLFVGRLVGVKRLDVLIEAFRHVYSQNPQARLYLAGSGPDGAKVREEIVRHGLDAAIHLVGPVEQNALPLWYQAASATVLSSDSEGLPNVLRESLACGTPFVSTNVGSVCEISNPEHSLLVPAGRAHSLGEAMLHILNPGYQAGALKCRVGSWQDCANDYLKVMLGKTATEDFDDVSEILAIQSAQKSSVDSLLAVES